MVTDKEAEVICDKIMKKQNELKEELKMVLDGNHEFLDAMFEKYIITVDDIRNRKKREKVCDDERCKGIKKNGENCSRRKLTGKDYCGTHEKGNGVETTEIEATVQDGIVKYIDPVSGQPIPVDQVLRSMS